MSLTCVTSQKVKKVRVMCFTFKALRIVRYNKIKISFNRCMRCSPRNIYLPYVNETISFTVMTTNIYSVTCVTGVVTCVTCAHFFQISSNLTMKITWLGYISLEIPLTHSLKPIEFRIRLLTCNKWSYSTSLKGPKSTQT